ncbi:discoidin domain-containing protein [Aestuariibacter sp. A3R04]|uniref:discoidin domain-containing protein n=1 Tax=Aestuariibacter sp. A3R04 TaxID=2841571 RepID=UPI001C093736|nr:discoidin domain-containing protein [Aestuariibacter sp. A3R04]MBU3020250.1 discoidin domain-containing protein [Aestuariibacter sp. A3R04]
MNNIKKTKVSLCVAAVLGLLSGCGGSSNEPDPQDAPQPPSTQAELSGSVIKGTMIGANLSATALVGGEASSSGAETDSNGTAFFTVNSKPGFAFKGLYRIDATADNDTTMICDASACGAVGLGETVDATQLDGVTLSTLTWVESPLGSQADGTAEAEFQANALTTFATVLVEQAIAEGRNISAQATLLPAQSEYSVLLMRILGVDASNVDVFSMPLVSVDSVDSVADLSGNALTASLINAALANTTEDVTIAAHINALTALVKLAAAGDEDAITQIRTQLLAALTAHPVVNELAIDPATIVDLTLPVVVESQASGPVVEYTTAQNIASAAIEWRAEISEGESGDKVFDNDNNTKWLDNAAIPSAEEPSWISIAFEQAIPVNTLSITSANDAPDRDPENVSLEASNDGEQWITLGEWAGLSFDDRFQTLDLPVDNSLAYTHYRMNVTKNKGDTSLMQIAEVELSGPLEAAVVHSDSASEITARGFISDGEAPEMAFDGSSETKWLDDSGVPSETDPSWVDLAFASPVNVNTLAMISANDAPSRDPENFSVLGSNDDGETWTTLASWVGETFDERFERKSFSFQNAKSFSLYRINITKNAGDDSLMQVAELSLIGPASAPENLGAASGVVVEARGAISEAEAGAMAFDGDANTKWLDDTGIPTAEDPSFATVTLPEAKAVTTFTITSANDAPSRDPENVALLGSDDGEDWFVLGEWAGLSFDERFETQTFALSNMRAFSRYEVQISKNKGDDSLMQVAEFGLYGTDYAAVDHSDNSAKVVTARAAISDAEAGEMVFDNSIATKWLDNAGIPTTDDPSWVEIVLPEPVVVNQFAMTSANDAPSRDPENFVLLGSNDGENWQELGAWAGESFDERFERKVFSTTNGRAFSQYRINITKNKGDDSLMQVAEFELLGPQL